MSEDRRFGGQPATGASRDSSPDGATSRELATGSRVLVKSGAFAGKAGVVAGHDAKGAILVVLGQITVTLPPDEVELAPGAARGRTVLSSSHVKKPAARSGATSRAGGKKVK